MRGIRPHSYTIRKGTKKVRAWAKVEPKPRQHNAHVRAWREELLKREYKAKWGEPFPD